MLDEILEWGEAWLTVTLALQLIFGAPIAILAIMHFVLGNPLLGVSVLILYVLFWMALFSVGALWIIIKRILKPNE